MEINSLQSSICVLVYAHTEQFLQFFTIKLQLKFYKRKNQLTQGGRYMSEEKKKEILENLDKLPEEKKAYVFGYVEGICQMAERKEEKPKQV